MFQIKQQNINKSSSFVCMHYPRAFGEFCIMRFWVETNPSYGQRCVTQMSKDADNGVWYKQKYQAYADIVILMQDLDSGLVIPLVFKFKEMDNKSFTELATSDYSLTAYQKSVIHTEWAMRIKVGGL